MDSPTTSTDTSARDDARLIVEFNQWAINWGFHDANKWFWGPDYSTDPGWFLGAPLHDERVQNVYTVLGYYETLGLFYRRNVVDRELLLEWMDYMSPWDRIEPLATAHRPTHAYDGLWENFEMLGTEQRRWFDQTKTRT